jgi:hypothetical protein
MEDSMKQECGTTPPSNEQDGGQNRIAFNFDEWLQLARENPEEFERRREQLIRETVSHMNAHNQRTHGLSWRIEMERKRSDSPVENLMWMAEELRSSLARLNEECNEQARRLKNAADK